MHGSYEAIAGGQVVEALEMITGGKGSRIRPSNIGWTTLMEQVQSDDYFVGAGSQQQDMTDVEGQRKRLQGASSMRHPLSTEPEDLNTTSKLGTSAGLCAQTTKVLASPNERRHRYGSRLQHPSGVRSWRFAIAGAAESLGTRRMGGRLE